MNLNPYSPGYLPEEENLGDKPLDLSDDFRFDMFAKSCNNWTLVKLKKALRRYLKWNNERICQMLPAKELDTRIIKHLRGEIMQHKLKDLIAPCVPEPGNVTKVSKYNPFP